MTLIGLNGKAGSGKDTFANFLIEDWGYKRYSFAKALKDAVLVLNPYIGWRDGVEYRVSDAVVDELGWDEVKREIPEIRRLLQIMGTEVGRQILGENVWVDIVKNQWVADGKPDAVITDMRFPNEVAFVKSVPESVTILIERENNPHAIAATHASERLTFVPDIVVNNNGTLEEFREEASSLVRNNVVFYQGF